MKSGDLDWSDETADGLVLVRLGLALFAFLLGLPLLLWFCWLRETPIFWRNVGGYPVWFREVVLEAYYPVFGLNVALMLLYFYLIVTYSLTWDKIHIKFSSIVRVVIYTKLEFD